MKFCRIWMWLAMKFLFKLNCFVHFVLGISKWFCFFFFLCYYYTGEQPFDRVTLDGYYRIYGNGTIQYNNGHWPIHMSDKNLQKLTSDFSLQISGEYIKIKRNNTVTVKKKLNKIITTAFAKSILFGIKIIFIVFWSQQF